MIEPIRKSVEVPCDTATAFDIMTRQIASWWPLDGHSVSAMNGQSARDLTLEPKVGGRLYETGAEGETIPWGTVTVFEPGHRIVLAWYIMKPEAEASEVEFRFHVTARGTRVDLEHRGFNAAEPGVQDYRDRYANGWARVFETCFAGACADRAA